MIDSEEIITVVVFSLIASIVALFTNRFNSQIDITSPSYFFLRVIGGVFVGTITFYIIHYHDILYFSINLQQGLSALAAYSSIEMLKVYRNVMTKGSERVSDYALDKLDKFIPDEDDDKGKKP